MKTLNDSRFGEVVDSEELLFQLQDSVKAAQTRVAQKRTVLEDLETFEKSIQDSREVFNSRKRLFSYLLFERFRVKERLLIEKSISHLDRLLDVFRPEEEDEEDGETKQKNKKK